MTPVEHAARAASAALGVGAPLSASAARTRARASVMRVGRLAGRDEAELRRGRLGDFAGADRHAQEHAARRQCPARRPVDEVAQRGTERRPVEDLGDRFEIVAAGGARRPHDAGRDAGAQRHAHEGAGFELERLRARGSCKPCRRRPARARRRLPMTRRRVRAPIVRSSWRADKKAGGIAAGLACSRTRDSCPVYSLAAALRAALALGVSTRSAMRADLPRRSRR